MEQDNLKRTVPHFSRHPEAARQLHRLGAFSIPQDLDDRFRGLLARLDRAEHDSCSLADDMMSANPGPA
ncbi:hypothetical protein FHX08_003862 [Rhizobium sp. BK529]|uniref:hypothetical protein n=1 Tax=unclassified Rhizobium TaxID=2613769 RepID=UPI00104C0E6C|nr:MULTISPECIES: hypothetical protein [unclassified Rhizobium]MBB3593459.1 hypothetical protein [Rhizobium sp. BK529]